MKPIALVLPEGTLPQPPPPPDLSVVPGAEVVYQQSWRTGDDQQIDVICVGAGLPWWLDGLEQEILAGALGVIRKQTDMGWARAGAVEAVGVHFEQSFEAGGAGQSGVGRSVLGFVRDESPQLQLCSCLCRHRGAAADSCERAVGTFRVTAEFIAPPRSVVAESLTQLASHPAMTLGVSASLATAVVMVWLWRRPRPRCW